MTAETSTYPPDPVEPFPSFPLIDSYTYNSPLPVASTSTSGSAHAVILKDREETVEEALKGFAERNEQEDGWVMGIDEAGRGPVLGPMVYAAAYCPLPFLPTVESLGFDDSKALSPEKRQQLWAAFSTHEPLCYSSTSLSPQDISSGMLRRAPFNLNRQAEEATIGLIREALKRGVNLKEIYVDALGPAAQWQARLSAIFPTIAITVQPKADSLYKIVSAASIIAKVTRDRWIEKWVHPEGEGLRRVLVEVRGEEEAGRGKKGGGKGKGKGKGKRGKKVVAVEEDKEEEDPVEGEETDKDEEGDSQPVRKKRKLEGASTASEILSEASGLMEAEAVPESREELGSGYPSDPRTQSYLKTSFSPLFGYPSLVRFSWAGPKLQMEKDAFACKWIDEDEGNGNGQMKLNFGKGGGSGSGSGGGEEEKGRAKMWKELGMSAVGSL